MTNGSDASRVAELEGVPPKLYKLALGAASGALFLVLTVMGGIVWRLNSDCPAVQRDLRAAEEHIAEHSGILDELQRTIPEITREEWRDIGNRLIRLEESRAADAAKVKQIEADIRSLHPWKVAP